MDLEDYGIQLDEDGRLVGFQAGKAAALLDWEHRKQATEFLKLCRALYRRNWNAAHREHYNAYMREYRAKQARQRRETDTPFYGPVESLTHRRHRYYLKNKPRFLEKSALSMARMREALGPEAFSLHRKIIAMRSIARQKARGRCISCGAASSGSQRCESCRKKDCAIQTERRLAAIARGLCGRCKRHPLATGVTLCAKCRARQKRYDKKRLRALRKRKGNDRLVQTSKKAA